MKKIPHPERQLAYLAYTNREHAFQHQQYGEEVRQYRMMQSGDPQALKASRSMMSSTLDTKLSADPLRNAQYLFVASITLATRYAIEGGMENETAYNASDMYIRKADQCKSVEEVLDLHQEMFGFFTSAMADLRKTNRYPRAVAESMAYIESNLHMPLRIEDAAKQAGLSTGYFSVLFHRETGLSFSDYVLSRRIETAENMLRYSDYSSTEISEILAFSSQSYFIRCFRKLTGMTPSAYRRRYYARGMKGADGAGADPEETWKG